MGNGVKAERPLVTASLLDNDIPREPVLSDLALYEVPVLPFLSVLRCEGSPLSAKLPQEAERRAVATSL